MDMIDKVTVVAGTERRIDENKEEIQRESHEHLEELFKHFGIVGSKKITSFVFKIYNTLVKDLACRLPYNNTKVRVFDKDTEKWHDEYLTSELFEKIRKSNIGLVHLKVYLRPVNSLTQAECDEIFREVLGSEDEATEHGDWIKFRCDGDIEFIFNRRSYRDVQKLYDWMYAHNIDVNNLAEYNLTMQWPPLSK